MATDLSPGILWYVLVTGQILMRFLPQLAEAAGQRSVGDTGGWQPHSQLGFSVFVGDCSMSSVVVASALNSCW